MPIRSSPSVSQASRVRTAVGRRSWCRPTSAPRAPGPVPWAEKPQNTVRRLRLVACLSTTHRGHRDGPRGRGTVSSGNPLGSCVPIASTTQAGHVVLVDSNCTRTEPYVSIRPNPEAEQQIDLPKAYESQRIPRDQPSESGDAGGSENPGVGGSIPSQPTICFLLFRRLARFGASPAPRWSLDLARTCLIPCRRAVLKDLMWSASRVNNRTVG